MMTTRLVFCILFLIAPLGYCQHQGLKGDAGSVGLNGVPGRFGFTGVKGEKGEQGQVGIVGLPGRLGFPGPSGPADAVCGRGLLGPIGDDLETLEKSTTKLEQVISYDFVRRVGEKYFVSNKERGSFSTAVDFCSQRGLELASPQNEEENNVLTRVFGDVHKTAWINVNSNKAEGNFETDLKNRRLTFTKWGEGQPDRSIQDTGCTTLSENGAWRVTRECFMDAFIVCQM